MNNLKASLNFQITLFFFYKNLFYKNVEAETDPNFKNVLRTFLRLRVD